MPTLYGTCPKCKTEYTLKGNTPPANAPVGYICPNCKEKGVTMPGVVHFESRKPTLREAAGALLKHILENSVCDESCNDGDGHIDQWSSPELESLTNELERALKR